MKKREFIARYGEEKYEKYMEQGRQWIEAHPERVKELNRQRYKANPEKAKKYNHNRDRKGGKFYLKTLKYSNSGLRGERNKIRHLHERKWREFKKIIAPGSQIHHSWVPQTAEYAGVALVESVAHIHGIIDVIKILDGEITLFTEKEIREQEREHGSE